MKKTQPELSVFVETTTLLPHAQIGVFREVLDAEDARLLASVAFSENGTDSGISALKATVALTCSYAGSAEIAKAAPMLHSWQVTDERGGFGRLLGLGTVAMQLSGVTEAQLAEVLRSVWPVARVVVCMGDAPAGRVATDWMFDVDPPASLVASFARVLVSFFHGRRVDVYERGVHPRQTAERVINSAAVLGRQILPSREPF